MIEGDVIVIGAGIIGTAYAWQLAARGQWVTLIDDGNASTTTTGVGHLMCMDDDPAELAPSAWSLESWRKLVPWMPESCVWREYGTLRLVETRQELALAEERQRRMVRCQVVSEMQTRDRLTAREPLLTAGLADGLWVPDNGIIYAPNVARWFINDADLTYLRDNVLSVDAPYVTLRSGKWLRAPAIVIASGLGANTLLGEGWLRPKKDQLAITDRYGPLLSHQLIELGYGASAHVGGISLALSVQPRPTGQLLIGSSRQFDNTDREVDPPLLAQMLVRACHFLPSLEALGVIRCWSGFRAASTDGSPLIDPHPARPGIWLALGHEGLSVTTAPATTELLHAQILGGRPAVSPDAWLPSRLYKQEAITRQPWR